MNTTITKDQMILHDGEVYVLKNGNHKTTGDFIATTPSIQRQILYSTAKLDGVQHLQREWFVKVEGMEEMARKYMDEKKQYDIEYHMNESGLDYVEQAYIDGYTVKKSEFVKQHLEKAFEAGVVFGANGVDNFEAFYNTLRPLELPEKIVLSPDGELVEIQW